VDGYNVLITVESLLAGYPIYLCDDGFLRDIRGIYRSFKCTRFTVPAISAILDLLALVVPLKVNVLFDQQMSHSGKLADKMRCMMANSGLPGTARTDLNVDRSLVESLAIVASSDGAVIDGASLIVDLPAEIARRRGTNFLVTQFKQVPPISKNFAKHEDLTTIIDRHLFILQSNIILRGRNKITK
jgi:hypothetical protein